MGAVRSLFASQQGMFVLTGAKDSAFLCTVGCCVVSALSSQLSSVVEQRFCKPSVVGSNPTAGSSSSARATHAIHLCCDLSFLLLGRREILGHRASPKFATSSSMIQFRCEVDR
jgi:hypothetical protein